MSNPDRENLYDQVRRASEADHEHVNCRCTPMITKDPEKLPRLSARRLASTRRVIKQDAEIFLRASKGSWSAKQVIYDARGTRPFASN